MTMLLIDIHVSSIIKTFTNSTSNHHLQDVIFNLLVWLQAKEIQTAMENKYEINESYPPVINQLTIFFPMFSSDLSGNRKPK